VAVLLEMSERTLRRVDRQLRKVRTAKTLQLRVEVREVPALQKRVVREVDPRHHVLRAECHLFRIGKEIVRHAVEHQPPDNAHRQDFFRDQLGRIEDVEIELFSKGVVEELNAKFPFREGAGIDRVPQVAAVEVRIRAVDLDGFVPRDRLQTELRLPVKLDECRLAPRVHKSECVNTETFHETI
jgi:hypothetical protein